MEAIPELDDVMASAWPPEIAEPNGPWLNRFASAVTRRANSVLAIGEPACLSEAIVQAEEFYDQRHLPAVFLLSDASVPPDLEPVLSARGYTRSAETRLLWANIEDSLSTSANAGADHNDAAGQELQRFRFTSEPVATDKWFETYNSAQGASPLSEAKARVLRDHLLAPRLSTRFVSAWRPSSIGEAPNQADLKDAPPLVEAALTASSRTAADAVAQVVVDGDWACIQCLATSPEARRRGAGSNVVDEALRQAKVLGATRAFAAVMVSNIASADLFRRSGFIESHRYRYLTAGPGEA